MPIGEHSQTANAAYAQTEGKRWVGMLEPEFQSLPSGTVIVINVATGEYVTGPSQHDALKVYHRRFGFGQTVGWVHEIGREIFLGGGIV